MIFKQLLCKIDQVLAFDLDDCYMFVCMQSCLKVEDLDFFV